MHAIVAIVVRAVTIRYSLQPPVAGREWPAKVSRKNGIFGYWCGSCEERRTADANDRPSDAVLTASISREHALSS